MLDTKRKRFENNFWEYEEKHFNIYCLYDEKMKTNKIPLNS